MKPALGIVLATSLTFTSCAKKPTTRITVKLADTFIGNIRLTPCISVAKDPVEVDGAGYGYTQACPAGDVEIVVIKPSKTYELAPETFVCVGRATENQVPLLLRSSNSGEELNPESGIIRRSKRLMRRPL